MSPKSPTTDKNDKESLFGNNGDNIGELPPPVPMSPPRIQRERPLSPLQLKSNHSLNHGSNSQSPPKRDMIVEISGDSRTTVRMTDSNGGKAGAGDLCLTTSVCPGGKMIGLCNYSTLKIGSQVALNLWPILEWVALVFKFLCPKLSLLYYWI